MTSDLATLISVFSQIAMFAVLLFFCVRLIRESNRSLTAVFLTFAFTLWLLTDLYWIIYDFMRPGSRMPFAVNEIGEAAVFLLIAATLSVTVPYWFSEAWKQADGAFIFAAGNIVLWIAWSGEWLQDLLVGAAFAYLLYVLACSLKRQQALSKAEWIGLGFACGLIIAGQGLTFVVTQPAKGAIDTGCYLLMAAGVVLGVIKLWLARKQQESPKTLLCLSAALLVWNMTAKYMSDGSWYIVFLTVETLCMPLLFLSARKAVTEA